MEPLNIIIFVAIVVGFWILAKVVQYVIEKVLGKWASRTDTTIDDEIIKMIKRPLKYLLILIGLHYAFVYLELPSWIDRLVQGIIFVLGATWVMILGYRLMDLTLKWYLERMAEKVDTKFSTEFAPLVRKVLVIFIFLIGLIVVLNHFNYDILSLVTALGVGSLAVGLAAKDTLANMIAGFTIMIDRPFRVGDRIKVEDELGHVVDIGMRSTKVETFDHTILIIPNSEVVNTKIINYHYPDNHFKAKVEVGIAYGSDIERAKEIMVGIAASQDGVGDDPPPQAWFMGFGDSALNLMLRYWVEDLSRWFDIQDQVHRNIHDRFAEEGIEIPFPQRVLYMRQEEVKSEK